MLSLHYLFIILLTLQPVDTVLYTIKAKVSFISNANTLALQQSSHEWPPASRQLAFLSRTPALNLGQGIMGLFLTNVCLNNMVSKVFHESESSQQ